jgi:hypothetical protein
MYLQEVSNLQINLFESCRIDSWNPKDRAVRRNFSFSIGKFEDELSLADATKAYYCSTLTVNF